MAALESISQARTIPRARRACHRREDTVYRISSLITGYTGQNFIKRRARWEPALPPALTPLVASFLPIPVLFSGELRVLPAGIIRARGYGFLSLRVASSTSPDRPYALSRISLFRFYPEGPWMDPWRALEPPQVSIVRFYPDAFFLALDCRLTTGGNIPSHHYGAPSTLPDTLRLSLRKVGYGKY